MVAPEVIGLLLAAGAGRRAGGPKALRVDPDGTSWLVRSIRVLIEGGCPHVIVVLGAAAADARALLEQQAAAFLTQLSIVEATDWADGLGASLGAGLTAALEHSPSAVVVQLVDLPDVSPAVVRRVLERAEPTALVRAGYGGRPGHPVLIGHDHLTSVIMEVGGDRGAQAYLDRHGVRVVECGDLATGVDQDRS